jgi:DsbC/DsbD-like thiol-disulfide interchange protein
VVRLGSLIVCIALTSVGVVAQANRPRAEVTPVVATEKPKAGAPLALSLEVVLPKDVHVQANKPRDPSLIPTVLTLTPPEGVTVDDVTYPAPTELAQKDRKDTLAVLGPQFTIEIKATLAAGVGPGELKIPGVLRYQACNDSVCFAPARANAQWTVRVE